MASCLRGIRGFFAGLTRMARHRRGAPGGEDSPRGQTAEPVDCSERRQGDVAAIHRLPIGAGEGVAEWIPTSAGVVVVSQTCDVVNEDRTTVVVAAITHLEPSQAAAAALGRRPGLVAIPGLGPLAFADLDVLATLTKSELQRAYVSPGVDAGDDQAVREFGQRVGRRFSRFAFPDEVVPWLRPLEELLAKRHRKDRSPEKPAVDLVVQFRIEALGGWAHGTPYDLKLIVVVPAGTLPPLSEDADEPSPQLLTWLSTPTADSPAICDRLFGSASLNLSAPDRNLLWQSLAGRWADRCVLPAGAGAEVRASLAGPVGAEAVSDDEYPMSRLTKSVQLDLDHLSPPFPHGADLTET